MYHYLIKPLLFLLPIERAHRLVLWLLRLIGWVPGGRWLLHKSCAVEHPSLEREVFGVHFSNPVGLAAGFDSDGEVYRELSALGFGFVEIGTITPQRQAGNPRPRVFRLKRDRAIIHRLGNESHGLEGVIERLRHPHKGYLVGCNIGRNSLTPTESAPADYLKLFRNLYQYADYFTVNPCMEACEEGCKAYLEAILAPLFDFRRGQNQYRPIMLKVSPEMSNEVIDQITEILVNTPLDGIVACDGTTLREGLQTTPASLNKIGKGRLCGAPLLPRAIEIVERIHTRSGGGYPIIGVGGIMSVKEARAMLRAGANLIQLYTGFVYEGPRLIKQICQGLIADAEAEKSAQEAAGGEEQAEEPTNQD